MSRIVIQSGDEVPSVRSAMDYLADMYGIPDSDIRTIEMKAEVGDVPRITATLFMNTPETVAQIPPRLAERLQAAGWTPPPLTLAETIAKVSPPAEKVTAVNTTTKEVHLDLLGPANVLAPSVPECPRCGGCCLAHGADHRPEEYVCEKGHWVNRAGVVSTQAVPQSAVLNHEDSDRWTGGDRKDGP